MKQIVVLLAVATISLMPLVGNAEITNLNLTKQDTEAGVELYHYNLPIDDRSINGYLIKPEGKGPFPGVVVNHGGYSSSSNFGIDIGKIFAQKGYVAIACDYTHKELRKYGIRGPRAGWEAGASRENIFRALKNIDILKSLEYVDKNKILMLGNSMGGFLTLGVVQKSDSIKAAVIIVAGIKNGNPQNSADRVIEAISPPEDLVDDISCPLLLLNGENDEKVDIKYPKHLKSLLDRYKKRSRLIIYPGVGHDLLRRYQNDTFKEIFDFFDEHIRKYN